MRWCDLTCPEASFPDQEAVDAAARAPCRTFSALHCRVLGRAWWPRTRPAPWRPSAPKAKGKKSVK